MKQTKFPKLEVLALEEPSYNQIRLLDWLRHKFDAKNDYELAASLEIAPSYISKLRNRHGGLSSGLMILIHERLGVPFNDIRGAASLPLYHPACKQSQETPNDL